MEFVPDQWILLGMIAALVLLILLIVRIWWRRRQRERWQNMDQLNSVYNARERRRRGD